MRHHLSMTVQMAAPTLGPTEGEYQERRQEWKQFWTGSSAGMTGVEIAAGAFLPTVAGVWIASRHFPALSAINNGWGLLIGISIWIAGVAVANLATPGLRGLLRPAKVFSEEAGEALAAPGWMYHPHFKSVKRAVRQLELPSSALEVFEAISEDSTASVETLIESAKSLDND